MKKAFLALFSAIILASCGQLVPEESPKYVEVSFSMAGEVASIETSPLTKVDDPYATMTSITMYGIQVYRLRIYDMGGGHMGQYYEPYANGIFTNLQSLQSTKVMLLADETYKFEVTVVDNFTYDSSMNPTPPTPFMGGMNANNSNRFDISPNNLGLTTSMTIPNAYDRYYGYEEGFQPDPDDPSNNLVTIDAYRMSFGFKLILNNLTEGSVATYFGSDSWNTFNNITFDPMNTSGSYQTETLRLLNNFDPARNAAIQGIDYSEQKTVNFIWTKNDGTTVPLLAPLDINFYRNKLTTVTININGNNPEGSVDINFGETMAVDQTNHTYDSGSSIPSGPNPNPLP